MADAANNRNLVEEYAVTLGLAIHTALLSEELSQEDLQNFFREELSNFAQQYRNQLLKPSMN